MTTAQTALAVPYCDAAPPLPKFVQIEPVGQCNLRCRMCAIQYRRDGPPHGPLAFLPFADFTRLVEGFGAIEELQLQGLGEPTMHPRFFDMVAWASERGIVVSTNSNLTLWSERRARQCVDSGLAELHASLDAATPAIYPESIRSTVDGGVLFAVEREPSLSDLRGVGFWYVTAGLGVGLLGLVVRDAERRAGRPPRALGWGLLGFTGWGVALMPKSGFWAFTVPAVLTLRRSADSR